MTAPLISVLLPVYNAERYLREAVESVLAQTFRDFELLTFDDGSSDGSLAILQELACSDSRVVVLSGQNRGIVPVLNDLIARARGEYLARMDADDVCMPARFAQQASHLAAHSDCVAVGSRVTLIDDAGQSLCGFIDKFSHGDIDAAHLRGGKSHICHPTVMMRAEAVRHIGGYSDDFRFAEDVDLFLRLAEIGSLANLPDILLRYRQHRSAIGATRSAQQRRSARMAAEEACIRRGVTPGAWTDQPEDEPSHADIHRKWAWWALGAGSVATARKHAALALLKAPLSPKNFRLVVCAVRGY